MRTRGSRCSTNSLWQTCSTCSVHALPHRSGGSGSAKWCARLVIYTARCLAAKRATWRSMRSSQAQRRRSRRATAVRFQTCNGDKWIRCSVRLCQILDVEAMELISGAH